MLIQGGFGTGKTSLCAALAPWALATFRNSRFWTEQLYLTRLKQVIQEDGNYSQAIHYLLDDDFVIYDDLGSADNKKFDPTGWRQEVIAEMVDNRWSSQLPTVITTNLTSDQILDLYGGRVHSRLFDKRNFVIVDYQSKDSRRF